MNTRFRDWLSRRQECIKDENWVDLIWSACESDILSTLIQVLASDAAIITDVNVWNAILAKRTPIILPDESFYICNQFTLPPRATLANSILKCITFTEPVKTFPPEFFLNCQIECVSIPYGTISLGNRCFAYSSIDELRLPSSLKKIMYTAFIGAEIRRVVYDGTQEQFWELPTYVMSASRYFQLRPSQPPITVVCSDGSFTLDSPPITHS